MADNLHSTNLHSTNDLAGTGPDVSAFVADMIAQDVLRFGEFTLKSGRQSPYFFNLGAIDDGSGLARLGAAYARCIAGLAIDFDVIFGPAYKGIPIAVATATALAAEGRNIDVAFNRKEAKDHGEGGLLVGASIEGRRVLVVDDVMTAGTAINEAAGIIDANGGSLVGIVVAMDRQELADSATLTAVESVSERLSVPVKSIATLADVIGYLAGDSYGIERENDRGVQLEVTERANARALIIDYQRQYCRIL